MICQDNLESLGFWKHKLPHPLGMGIEVDGYEIKYYTHTKAHNHIDTNCYAFTRETALKVAPSWHSGIMNDRNVFKKLLELDLVGCCTGQFTVNYYVDLKRFLFVFYNEIRGVFSEEKIQEILESVLNWLCDFNLQQYKHQPPWLMQ